MVYGEREVFLHNIDRAERRRRDDRVMTEGFWGPPTMLPSMFNNLYYRSSAYVHLANYWIQYSGHRVIQERTDEVNNFASLPVNRLLEDETNRNIKRKMGEVMLLKQMLPYLDETLTSVHYAEQLNDELKEKIHRLAERSQLGSSSGGHYALTKP